MTDTYNGWTNYETWVANLWMDGDEAYWRDGAESCMRTEDNDKESATYTLSQMMRDFYQDCMPDLTGMYADLLGAGLSRINWYEIAKHIVDGLDVEAIDDIEE